MELLVVITILGILAALSVPAFKNLGKSNTQVSATRQLLDDLARARQLAISRRTTVFMIFVPPEQNWWGSLPVSQLSPATNLLDKQYTGYTFAVLRSAGDQPGRGVPQYIGEWRSLPDGAFIATNKFNTQYLPLFNSNPNSPNYPGCNSYPISDFSIGVNYPINSFNFISGLPFPTETNYTFSATLWLPFVAFNYQGELTSDGVNLAFQDEYIPMAQGTVGYAVDVNKALIPAPADFTENPPGNSTNSMFHIIRVDRITGRATLLQQKVQ